MSARIVGLALLLASVICQGEENVALKVYLEQLSSQDGFELAGTSRISGSDSVTLKNGDSTDVSLTRALRQYNFVVSYSGTRITRVWILGRKGNSTGPLPDDQPVADVTTQ